MNVEKLLSFIEEIEDDFDKNDILPGLQRVVSSLQQYVGQPNPQTSQNFRTTLDGLNTSLDACDTNSLVPSKLSIFKEIDGYEYIGTGLRHRIETILSTNQVTPADSVQQLGELHTEVTGFYTRLSTTQEALTGFNIAPDELEENEYEIGIVFPREKFDSNLGSFRKEMQFVNLLVTTVSELVGESGTSPEIRTVASSNITIYLKTSAKVAAVIIGLVTGVVNIFDQVLDIQIKRIELEKMEGMEEITDALKEKEETNVTEGLDSLKDEFFEKECVIDEEGRRNQLDVSASMSLRLLAEKIDRGLTVEVSTPTVVSEPVDDSEESTSVENIAQLSEQGKIMSSLTHDREPILKLSTDIEDDSSEI